ncbi:MAG: peptidylprolyl isomerase [Planctomycetota bacterium]
MRIGRRLIWGVVGGLLCFVCATSHASLEPTKTWYAPGQPIIVKNTAAEVVEVRLTDFIGRIIDPPETLELGPGDEVNLSDVFPLRLVNTYVVYAVPPAAESMRDFLGTPLVVNVRGDDRPGATDGPVVTKVVPLEFAEMQTDSGQLRLAFYYNAAPRTVTNFLDLSRGGFYDGLDFHRVLPGYLIQGGDPLGDGTGGPGYRLAAEFNDVPLLPGTVAMSRVVDPLERQGALPRRAAADSAGSQFFMLLDPDEQQIEGLRRRYTVFARVVDGMDVLGALGMRAGERPVIRDVEVKPVTATANPYPRLLASPIDGSLLVPPGIEPTTRPSTRPATRPTTRPSATRPTTQPTR